MAILLKKKKKINPSYTPAPTLPHIIASSLPPVVPPSSTIPLLPPSHPPSFPACLSPVVQFNVHRLCVWQAALYCVASSHA